MGPTIHLVTMGQKFNPEALKKLCLSVRIIELQSGTNPELGPEGIPHYFILLHYLKVSKLTSRLFKWHF